MAVRSWTGTARISKLRTWPRRTICCITNIERIGSWNDRMNHKVRVGIIGSQFISSIHVDALKRCADAEVLAVASPTKNNARNFAKKHGIPHHFTDYRKLLEMDEVDLIVVGIPNDLHCRVTLDATAAGQHI